MPVRKQGWYVETTPDELNVWVGKESGKPVHTVTEGTDLVAELKRGLTYVREEEQTCKSKKVSRLKCRQNVRSAIVYRVN